MSAEHSAWARGIMDVENEAAGVMEIVVILPLELPLLLIEADFGGVEARRLARLALKAILTVHEAPSSRPILCVSCQRPMRRAHAFSVVLAVPRRPDPARCVQAVMCASCGTEVEQIEAKAIEAMRSLWPDARPIEITPNRVGHA